jgi:hypothetical protein
MFARLLLLLTQQLKVITTLKREDGNFTFTFSCVWTANNLHFSLRRSACHVKTRDKRRHEKSLWKLWKEQMYLPTVSRGRNVGVSSCQVQLNQRGYFANSVSAATDCNSDMCQTSSTQSKSGLTG